MEDNDLNPKELFHERIEIMGEFVSDDEKISDLHIILQYQLDKPSDIVGRVYGTQEDAEKLSNFCNGNNIYKLTAMSKNGYEVNSNQVFMKSYDLQPGLENSHYKIGEFLLNDIHSKDNYNLSGIMERHLTFYLAGPANTWGVSWSNGKSYTGNVQIEVNDSKIDLQEDLSFEIKMVLWHFHDSSKDMNQYNIETSVYAYSLITNLSCDEYSDDDFIKEGTQVVDKLVKLSSLITGSRVVWYGYSIRTQDSYLKYYRLTPDVGEDHIDYHSNIVNRIKSREFLVKSYNLLCNDPKMLDVLNMSLDYYLDGLDYKKAVDEKFILLFLALEKIKDIYSKQHGFLKILSGGQFNTISGEVKELIKKTANDGKSELMIEKILELNRPSFKSVIKELFSHYQIDISDLYPKKDDVNLYYFISMRNKLFHSGDEIDDLDLFKESKRLEYLLSRLFLRILGWEDLSMAPGEYNILAYDLKKD